MDSSVIEGELTWKDGQVIQNGKTYALSKCIELDFDRPLVNNSGEYIILSDGSILRAKSLKLNQKESSLLVEFREQDLVLKLANIRALSFQGAFYPSKNIEPGFWSTGDFYTSGEASYFTRTMIGQSKPQKKRYKKNLLKFLCFNNEMSSRGEFKIYTTSREIIYAQSIEAKQNNLIMKSSIGQLELPLVEINKIENSSAYEPLRSSHISQEQYTPYLSQCLKMQEGVSYTQSPIQLKGYGLQDFWSLHSRTSFQLQPPKGAKSFSAEFQFDPGAKNGHVEVFIKESGKELKRIIMAHGDVKALKLNLSGKPINVTIDYGKNGSAGDLLLMCNPRFQGGK